MLDIRYRAAQKCSGVNRRIGIDNRLAEWSTDKRRYHLRRTAIPLPPYCGGASSCLKVIWQPQLRTRTGSLLLQDHDSPVRSRNVWLRPLADRAFRYKPDQPWVFFWLVLRCFSVAVHGDESLTYRRRTRVLLQILDFAVSFVVNYLARNFAVVRDKARE